MSTDQSQQSQPSARVASEIASYGSLETAIAALWNDSCGAPFGSAVHDVLNEALAYQASLLSKAAA